MTQEALLAALLVVATLHVTVSERVVSDLMLVSGADHKGAVCLDGSSPGYYLARGGKGVANWLVYVEGGGWCDSDRECGERSRTYLGSTKHFGNRPVLPNTGILSDDPVLNPDFYDWNVAWLRYCDGASFLGNREEPVITSQDLTIYHRGARVWDAIVDDLLDNGMDSAEKVSSEACTQTLASLGSSDGLFGWGLTAILRCDSFKEKLPSSTAVKCLADGGFFLDVADVEGGRSSADMFRNVALTHDVEAALPKGCTDARDTEQHWECIFAANALPHVRTPLYVLQSGIDYWQLQNLVVPKDTDPSGTWMRCFKDFSRCNSSQLDVIGGFRRTLISDLGTLPASGGEFVISCSAHCMGLMNDRWYSGDSFLIEGRAMKDSVGDWFYDRSARDEKLIDGPYPTNPTCKSQYFHQK